MSKGAHEIIEQTKIRKTIYKRIRLENNKIFCIIYVVDCRNSKLIA